MQSCFSPGLVIECDQSRMAARFLEAVQAHAPRYYPLFLTLLRTGLRMGEALGLQWGDLDFHGRFIEVRRSYTRGRVEPPKNGKTRRREILNTKRLQPNAATP